MDYVPTNQELARENHELRTTIRALQALIDTYDGRADGSAGVASEEGPVSDYIHSLEACGKEFGRGGSQTDRVRCTRLAGHPGRCQHDSDPRLQTRADVGPTTADASTVNDIRGSAVQSGAWTNVSDGDVTPDAPAMGEPGWLEWMLAYDASFKAGYTIASRSSAETTAKPPYLLIECDTAEHAEALGDAITRWLTEDVAWDASKSPIVYRPRHWLYGDPGVSATLGSTVSQTPATEWDGQHEPGN